LNQLIAVTTPRTIAWSVITAVRNGRPLRNLLKFARCNEFGEPPSVTARKHKRDLSPPFARSVRLEVADRLLEQLLRRCLRRVQEKEQIGLANLHMSVSEALHLSALSIR